jgi:hypothetical protein
MRKFIIPSVVFFLLTCSVSAQMTGGGSVQNSSPAPAKTKAQSNRWSTLVFGLSNPIGKFKENDFTKPFEQAVGVMPGFYFGYDVNSYFGESDNPVKAGFSFSTGVAVHSPNWEKWVSGSTSFDASPFVVGDIKMGVIVSGAISDVMKVDGFLRLGVNYGMGANGHWSSEDQKTNFTTTDFGYGFGVNPGASFRYNRLLVTMQFNTGKMKFDYNLSGGEASLHYKVPVSTFRFGLGIVLGKNRK